MTMPHLGNCPHKPGTWCLACVREEWERREAERDEMERKIETSSAKSVAFDAIAALFNTFDTRFHGTRDEVLLTDDLLERCREIISDFHAKESKR